MEWPDAVNLLKYWGSHPPTNELVYVFMDCKPRDSDQYDAEAASVVNPVSKEAFNDLLKQHGIGAPT